MQGFVNMEADVFYRIRKLQTEEHYDGTVDVLESAYQMPRCGNESLLLLLMKASGAHFGERTLTQTKILAWLPGRLGKGALFLRI